MTQKHSFFLPVLISIMYLIWSGFFIYHSSFVAIDGERYFSLVDDAMISMRYAWNFSHGAGLVWNPNERVEGYSNFLMTLVMALATRFFDKKMAVLAVQIFGIPIVLICAWLTREIAKEIFKNHSKSDLLQNLSFISVLFYYYLSFWSLMGMETGLLTVLLLSSVYLTIRWIDRERGTVLYLLALVSGLAFLTRNDALVFSSLLFAYLLWKAWMERREKQAFRNVLVALTVYGFFVIGLTVFRWVYYGELVPNTYVLKVSHIPYLIRINDGIVYGLSFIRKSIIPLLFALVGVVTARDRTKWIFFLLFCTTMAYQIWVGGDAWSGWRFILPSLPLIFILSVAGVGWIGETLSKRMQNIKYLGRTTPVTAVLSIIFMLSLVLPFWRLLSFQQELTETKINKHNMDVTLAINKLTTTNAKLGVFFAGLIPYYTDHYAIDFLGKSDKYIANLYPHVPQKIKWLRTITIPGHNKYDLNYSIKKLQPDYIQRFYWAQQSIRGWAIQHYVRLEYQDAEGVITLVVKKDSPFINWDKGKILPWGPNKSEGDPP